MTKEAADALIAEYFPGIEPWQIILIERSTGWFAHLDMRFHAKGERWRRMSFSVRVGSDGRRRGRNGRIREGCYYKSARRALKALQDELRQLPGLIYDITGGMDGVIQ